LGAMLSNPHVAVMITSVVSSSCQP
jgi:hypothetical protein